MSHGVWDSVMTIDGHILTDDDKLAIISFTTEIISKKPGIVATKSKFIPAMKWLRSAYGGTLRELLNICEKVWAEHTSGEIADDAFLYG